MLQVDRSRSLALACSLALIGMHGNAAADASPVHGGVKGGVNLGTLSGNGATDASLHFGVALGGYVTLPLRGGSPLAVQIELLMTDRGADFTDLSGQDADEAFLYLDLPVLIRYAQPVHPRVRLFGAAGAGLDYMIDSKLTRRSDLNLVDVSAQLGAGAEIRAGGRRITGELRGTLGLLDALEPGDEKARTRTLSVLAAVSM